MTRLACTVPTPAARAKWPPLVRASPCRPPASRNRSSAIARADRLDTPCPRTSARSSASDRDATPVLASFSRGPSSETLAGVRAMIQIQGTFKARAKASRAAHARAGGGALERWQNLRSGIGRRLWPPGNGGDDLGPTGEAQASVVPEHGLTPTGRDHFYRSIGPTEGGRRDRRRASPRPGRFGRPDAALPDEDADRIGARDFGQLDVRPFREVLVSGECPPEFV